MHTIAIEIWQIRNEPIDLVMYVHVVPNDNQKWPMNMKWKFVYYCLLKLNCYTVYVVPLLSVLLLLSLLKCSIRNQFSDRMSHSDFIVNCNIHCDIIFLSLMHWGHISGMAWKIVFIYLWFHSCPLWDHQLTSY